MKKSASFVLSAIVLVSSMVFCFSASAETALVQLSNKVEDYILHSDADVVHEQDDSLVVDVPSYISVCELKDVSEKDIELNFNVKFEDIQTEKDADFVFEVSVRNQDPAKYLWEKATSYSLQFATRNAGEKRYIKSFFKVNTNGSDDGGWGFCDDVAEIVDGDTEAIDIKIKINSSNGDTKFELFIDGAEKISTVRTGTDISAGSVVFNSSKCKTIIKPVSVIEETNGKVDLSVKKDDWSAVAGAEYLKETQDSLIIEKSYSMTHYQLKKFSGKNIDVNFKVKFEDISAAHNEVIFEIALRNEQPINYLWQKMGFYSLSFAVQQDGTKKYLKTFFKTASGGADDSGFGFCDQMVEIVNDATPEMNITFSTITENGDTTFKLVVNGVEKAKAVKENEDRPAGAIAIDTLKCKTVISPFVKVEPGDDTTDSKKTDETTNNNDNNADKDEDDQDSPKTSDVSEVSYALALILIATSVVFIVSTSDLKTVTSRGRN